MMRAPLFVACSLLLAHASSCTRGVVGYDCPDAGCVEAPASAPPSGASPDAAVSSALDAGCEGDAADGCGMMAGEGICNSARDDGCCASDIDCLGDDDVFCHPKQQRCVECWEDAHCSSRPGEPYCVDHECKSCPNQAACRSDMQCEGECEDRR